MSAATPALDRPIRVVLRWQLVASAVLMIVAGLVAGLHGAISAALGGGITVVPGWIAARVALRRRAESAGDMVYGALAAEGVRIGLIVVGLWLVLALYRELVMPAFMGTFLVTVLIFAMAFFVRDKA